MSIEAYKKVWTYGLNGAPLVIALALAEHHNAKTGQCNPSYDTIAELTGNSRRHVIRVIKSLCVDGYITIDKSGGFHSNQYAFNATQTVTFETPNSDTIESPFDPPQTVTSETQTVTSDAQTVTSETPNSDIAMSPEPVEPVRTGIEPGEARRPTPPKPKKPPAVLAYANAIGFWPPKATYRILEKIPETDIALFQQIVIAYVGQGWNPKNINGMMDFLSRREIPGADNAKRNRNGKSHQPGPKPADQATTDKRRAALEREIAALEAAI